MEPAYDTPREQRVVSTKDEVCYKRGRILKEYSRKSNKNDVAIGGLCCMPIGAPSLHYSGDLTETPCLAVGPEAPSLMK